MGRLPAEGPCLSPPLTVCMRILGLFQAQSHPEHNQRHGGVHRSTGKNFINMQRNTSLRSQVAQTLERRWWRGPRRTVGTRSPACWTGQKGSCESPHLCLRGHWGKHELRVRETPHHRWRRGREACSPDIARGKGLGLLGHCHLERSPSLWKAHDHTAFFPFPVCRLNARAFVLGYTPSSLLCLVPGIELRTLGWQAGAVPLSYTPAGPQFFFFSSLR